MTRDKLQLSSSELGQQELACRRLDCCQVMIVQLQHTTCGIAYLMHDEPGATILSLQRRAI